MRLWQGKDELGLLSIKSGLQINSGFWTLYKDLKVIVEIQFLTLTNVVET